MKRTARIIATDNGNRIEVKVSFMPKRWSLNRKQTNAVVAQAANIIFNDLPQLRYHNFNATNTRIKM